MVIEASYTVVAYTAVFGSSGFGQFAGGAVLCSVEQSVERVSVLQFGYGGFGDDAWTSGAGLVEAVQTQCEQERSIVYVTIGYIGIR